MTLSSSVQLIEMLSNETTWAELIDILGSVNDETILVDVQRLLDIRNVVDQDELEIVNRSLRAFGLNVSTGILRANSARLGKGFDLMSEYQAVSGTSIWDRFCQLILNDVFRASRLWTVNYTDFFRDPNGTTIADGGNWWKTTHVELEIGTYAENAGFEMRYDSTLVSDISALLSDAGYLTEDEADFWAEKHVGLDINNTTDLQRYVRNYLFILRATEFFYQWAPIEDVLERVVTVSQVQVELRYAAALLVEPLVRNVSGHAEVVISESGFEYNTSELRPGQRFVFAYIEKYSDGTSVTHEAELSTYATISEQGTGYCIFEIPDYKSVVAVTLTCPDTGASETVNLTLWSNINTVDPTSISVTAQNPVYAGQRVPFTVRGTFGTSQVDITGEDGFLTFTSDFGEFDGSTLVLPDSNADLVANVSVTYLGTTWELTADYQLQVKRSCTDVVAVDLAVEAVATAKQGENVELRCTATYNDGSQKEVYPCYYLSSSKVSESGGILSSTRFVKDYPCSIVAEFADGGDILRARAEITFTAKAWKATDIKIELDTSLQEKTTYYPVAKVYIVDGDATAEQIATGSSDYVIGWRTLQGLWTGVDIDAAKAMPSVNSKNGSFTTPSVGADTEYAISFSGSYNGVTLSAFKKVTVLDLILSVQWIDVLGNASVNSNSSIAIRPVGYWSNGMQTDLDVDVLSLAFTPSASSIKTVRQDIEDQIADLTAAGKDASALDPDNPDYSQYYTLMITEGTDTVKDPVKGTTVTRKGVYYSGTLFGIITVSMEYTINGVTTKGTHLIAASPTLNQVTAISVEIPETVGDRSRTFVRSFVTFEDGTTEYVDAKWSANYSTVDDDPELVTFHSRTWSGLDLITVLENTTPTTFEGFLSLASSRLSIFENCTTFDDVQNVKAVGAVMQVEAVTDSMEMSVTARYYNSEASQTVAVIESTRDPINTIVSSSVIGPREFDSDVQYASYALSNVYQLSGIVIAEDGTEIDQGSYQYTMEVSSDWYILDQQELVNGEYVTATSTVATVDGDGYITPKRNVEAKFTLRTTFNDGFNAFSLDTEILMHKVNTYLTKLSIRGQDIVYDSFSLNDTAKYTSGLWYVPYSLRLFTVDDTDGIEIDPLLATWSIINNSGINGLQLDDQGRVYISTQDSDATVDISAQLTYTNGSNGYETIVGTRTLTIQSATAIISAYLDYTDAQIGPNQDIALEMVFTRRNGVTGSSADNPSGVTFEWSMWEGAPDGCTFSDGVIRFMPSETEQQATVQCILTEGRTSITEALVVRCPAVGYPLSISISGYSRVRDDSSVKFESTAERAAVASTDETANCYWTLRNSYGEVYDFTGMSIGARTGILTIDKISADVDLYVHCLFVEGDYRYEETHPLSVVSSLPRFGEGPFGINTLDLLNQYLTTKLNSTTGGTFILNARNDNYGYFACRKDYGDAVFTSVVLPDGTVNTNYGGWDGATWTLTDFNGEGPLEISVPYDNLTDTVTLYRTNKRAGLLAKFLVSYQ